MKKLTAAEIEEQCLDRQMWEALSRCDHFALLRAEARIAKQLKSVKRLRAKLAKFKKSRAAKRRKSK